MKLKEIFSGINCKIIGNEELKIRDLKTNSKDVNSGSLYICIMGNNYDGHDFIAEAESYGAYAIVTNKKVDTSITQVIVKDSRKVLSSIACAFYSHPERKMKIVGVIGTNGKTTTAFMTYSILKNCGIKCGFIGTIGTYYENKFIEPTLTTPDPIELQKTLYNMANEGITTVIMEVSAHAIYYDKVSGIDFYCGVFTNFSQDHLDFFKTMDNYEKAKLKFFKENKCKYVITNIDDKTGRKINELIPNSITYGINNPADIFAIDVKHYGKGEEFTLNLFDCVYNIKLGLIGYYNVYNALGAVTVCALLGASTEQIATLLNNFDGVDGRLQRVYDKDFSVFIDYAHTPDGLEKSLTSLKNVCKGRLICVFGCGGNRDKEKRPVMGEISGKYADFSVITSDNPRYEEPMQIIKEIEKGVIAVTKNYVIIQDREEGIKYALNMAKENDIIIVAGKGAEKYQEVLGIKTPYNDKDTIIELMRSTN